MTTFAPQVAPELAAKAAEAGLILHHYVDSSPTCGGDVFEVLDGSGTLYGGVIRASDAWLASQTWGHPKEFDSLDEALEYAMGGGPLKQRLGYRLFGGGHLGRKPR